MFISSSQNFFPLRIQIFSYQISWRFINFGMYPDLVFGILFLNFWPCCMACRILFPQPGIKPEHPALEVWSLNHWTTREVPWLKFFNQVFFIVFFSAFVMVLVDRFDKGDCQFYVSLFKNMLVTFSDQQSQFGYLNREMFDSITVNMSCSKIRNW